MSNDNDECGLCIARQRTAIRTIGAIAIAIGMPMPATYTYAWSETGIRGLKESATTHFPGSVRCHCLSSFAPRSLTAIESLLRLLVASSSSRVAVPPYLTPSLESSIFNSRTIALPCHHTSHPFNIIAASGWLRPKGPRDLDPTYSLIIPVESKEVLPCRPSASPTHRDTLL